MSPGAEALILQALNRIATALERQLTLDCLQTTLHTADGQPWELTPTDLDNVELVRPKPEPEKPPLVMNQSIDEIEALEKVPAGSAEEAEYLLQVVNQAGQGARLDALGKSPRSRRKS